MTIGETDMGQGQAHGPHTCHHGPHGDVAVVKVKASQGPGH